MWRLWTKGWGPRAWWYWVVNEGFPVWFAWRLPRHLAYWAFIRVYSADGEGPGPDYERVCRAWDRGEPVRKKRPVKPVEVSAEIQELDPR